MTRSDDERRRALEELLSLELPVGDLARVKRESVPEPKPLSQSGLSDPVTDETSPSSRD